MSDLGDTLSTPPAEVSEPDPWRAYQTDDPRPWVDPNGNRHTLRTKKFDSPQKYLDAGCVWDPRAT